MRDDQPGVRHPGPGAKLGQRAVELRDGVPDELDATIPALGQRIENLGIEDESAMDAVELCQRLRQRGIVETAQIAAKPDKGGIHRGVPVRGEWVATSVDGRRFPLLVAAQARKMIA